VCASLSLADFAAMRVLDGDEGGGVKVRENRFVESVVFVLECSERLFFAFFCRIVMAIVQRATSFRLSDSVGMCEGFFIIIAEQ
jgi:hypothetical protein